MDPAVHAFTMRLKAGAAEEYRRRHDAIWPELAVLLHQAGISDYSIFLDEQTNILFATYKLTADNRVEKLADNALMRKWWDYMAPLMATDATNRPLEKPLTPMFRLD